MSGYFHHQCSAITEITSQRRFGYWNNQRKTKNGKEARKCAGRWGPLVTGVMSWVLILIVNILGWDVAHALADYDTGMPRVELLHNEMIWTGSVRNTSVFDESLGQLDGHAAFTDLTRFNGDFFVTFRESSSHVGGTDGRVAVLRSTDDGQTWSRTADFWYQHPVDEIDSWPPFLYDLRDPKISVTSDGKLFVTTTGANYQHGSPADRRNFVTFWDPDTQTFGPLTQMQPAAGSRFQENQSDWLWRETWHKGMAYGTSYRTVNGNSSSESYLLRSSDGIHQDIVTEIQIPGMTFITESTIRFDHEDRMYVLIRANDNQAYIGTADQDSGYTDFSWNKLIDDQGNQRRLGGPNFVIGPDGQMIVGSRKYGSEGTSDAASKTNLSLITADGKWTDLYEFKDTRGDTGYPGMVLEGHTLYVSYYSQANIYFAKLDLSPKPAHLPEPSTAILLLLVSTAIATIRWKNRHNPYLS